MTEIKDLKTQVDTLLAEVRRWSGMAGQEYRAGNKDRSAFYRLIADESMQEIYELIENWKKEKSPKYKHVVFGFYRITKETEQL